MTNRIKPNFIYPDIPPEAYHFGSGEVEGTVLRQDGDWRSYVPPAEDQNRNGVESAVCYIEAQQHTIATILEEQYDSIDNNFSARFNAIYANGTPVGGDPLKAAQTFRDNGLIPDDMLPFSDEIQSWEEFCSWKGGDKKKCDAEGKRWREVWNPHYDIVVRREYDTETKYARLKEALKYSPVCVSVAQGYDNGNPKPKGLRDIHLVELVYIDKKNNPYIWDTYYPYLKKLAPLYDFEFGMRWTVDKTEETEVIKISILTQLRDALLALIDLLKRRISLGSTSPVSSLFSYLKDISAVKPVTLPVELPRASQGYQWDTKENIRHSIRVICDEEGLTLEQKNTLCATVQAESGFYLQAKNVNYDSHGRIASIDYGLCQWNDYYHGKEISPGEAVNNPEKAVRLMCRYWKRGQRNLWIAYKSGAYKKYL